MSKLGLRLDLREFTVAELDGAVAAAGDYPNFLLTAWQWAAWSREGNAADYAHRMLIVVPDFLYYARLGSTGQAKEIIQLPGSYGKVMLSGISNALTNAKNLPGLASGDFWAAAETLTAYDLGLLPRNFPGEVVMQYNLTDFTWLFERQQFLKTFSKLAAKSAGWALGTQQLAMGLSACARWNLKPTRFLYTSGASRAESRLVSAARAECFTSTRFTLDLTQFPEEMICGDDAGELRRDYDDEWLLSYSTGISLMKQTSLLTT